MVETIARRLREVTVRPAVGADERCRWDALMGAHHYLPFRGLVGRSVRHVAVLGERWLALIGWHAGAFKLKARDRWIGWLPEQQFVRLHLIANNARFLILPGCAAANLASRVLGLSLRRLSGDFHALHGHPILIAETFVDRSRFTGACYRAANWQVLGQTRGFARKPGTPATWVPHGRPKEVLVYPLARDAREQLCRLDDAPKWRSEGDRRPWTAHRLRSLWECLHGVPDFRSTRGRRYPLATIVTIAVAAKLAGYHGATAIGEFSQGLTQHQLRALRAFYSPRLGRFTAPSTTAFVKVLTNLDPDVLDRAARTWAAQQASRTDPVAIDGKSIRGAARHNPGAKNLLVAAAEHRSGIVLGQEAVQDKSNEVPAVRTLLTGLDLAGRVVTLDALHTCHHTARCVVEHCGAHYVMTAVKDNCPNLLADLAGLDWEGPEVRATEHPDAGPRTRHTDVSKIDSTTCATSPTTKTAAGCEPATCRAISPASPTSPSPSFASTRASTPSPKPTGTTPAGPRTPCASSSTRHNAPPHATVNPRPLAPTPRQRLRSPAVQSELPVYFSYHSERTRYPLPCPPEPPIPPATVPQPPIPTNHVFILAPNKISPCLKNKDNSRQFKEYVTRLLGYGAVDINRVRECTTQRVTALGGGTLKQEESHVHRFPLPPSLRGRHGYRRLTITLAWLSPVNPRHQVWRRADLWFTPPQDPLRVSRKQADWQAVQRGTLQHEILEGEEAGAFLEGASLEIQVNCRAGAGILEDEIPYALATTLEVAEELDVDIYEEVRTAVYAIQLRTEANS